MSPYAIMLSKFTRLHVTKHLESQQTVRKDSGYIVGGLHCVNGQKNILYRLKAGKIVFFEKRLQAVHSNTFPYFTGTTPGFSLNFIKNVS